MKVATALLITLTIATLPAHAKKDNSASYQIGTFVSSSVAADGTITNTLHGDGTTVAGSVYENQLAVYTIKVPDGHWDLNTYTQNKDSMIRGMGMTPLHFKSEKGNPLDVLKGGERVLFRVEKHRLLNGVEISIYIPYADNPDKEFHFIGYFYPDSQPSQPQKATDNVKAMCEAHKLSPELEKQYCVEQSPAVVPASELAAPTPADATSQYSPADLQTAANLALLSCAQVKAILSNPQIATYLPYTWKTAQTRCKELFGTTEPASSVPHGFQLGIFLEMVKDSDLVALKLSKRQGVVVRRVNSGSLAEQMGIQVRDVILEINGLEVEDLQSFVQSVRSGEAKTFRIWRDGRAIDMIVPHS